MSQQQEEKISFCMKYKSIYHKLVQIRSNQHEVSTQTEASEPQIRIWPANDMSHIQE